MSALDYATTHPVRPSTLPDWVSFEEAYQDAREQIAAMQQAIGNIDTSDIIEGFPERYCLDDIRGLTDTLLDQLDDDETSRQDLKKVALDIMQAIDDTESRLADQADISRRLLDSAMDSLSNGLS